MPSIIVKLGSELPLSLALPGGEAGMYPRAHVYDPAGSEVGSSPFDLTHLALGRYTYPTGYTPPAAGTYTALFITYTDSGHTTESALYGRIDEGFFVTPLLANVDRNADLIESQRGGHTWQGVEVFYVDPVNGAAAASGTREDPLDTVTEALSLVTDSAHSIIFLISGAVAGPTTLVEDVTINKRYTFLRGPGRDFIWTRAGAGDTIAVTAEGVELAGFQLETDAVGAGAGVRVNGADFCRCKHLWINETRGSGIEISNSDHAIVELCNVINAGQGGSGHGIQVTPAGGQSLNVRIRQNHISAVPGNGINLNGANVDGAIIRENVIHRCTGWGINLADTDDAFITLNVLGLNTAGPINDGGTNTIQINNEQWGTGAAVDLIRKIFTNRLELQDGSIDNWELWDDDDLTVLMTWSVRDKNGNRIESNTKTPARRTKGV
jgi:hypothetical protein